MRIGARRIASPVLAAAQPVDVQTLVCARERLDRIADPDAPAVQRDLLGIERVGEDRAAVCG